MSIRVASTREILAQAYADAIDTASLHSGDPGTTGANEIAGGSPAYARQPVTWVSGTADGTVMSDTIPFDVPAGVDLEYIGLWEGTTFRDAIAIARDTTEVQDVYEAVVNFTQN